MLPNAFRESSIAWREGQTKTDINGVKTKNTARTLGEHGRRDPHGVSADHVRRSVSRPRPTPSVKGPHTTTTWGLCPAPPNQATPYVTSQKQ